MVLQGSEMSRKMKKAVKVDYGPKQAEGGCSVAPHCNYCSEDRTTVEEGSQFRNVDEIEMKSENSCKIKRHLEITDDRIICCLKTKPERLKRFVKKSSAIVFVVITVLGILSALSVHHFFARIQTHSLQNSPLLKYAHVESHSEQRSHSIEEHGHHPTHAIFSENSEVKLVETMNKKAGEIQDHEDGRDKQYIIGLEVGAESARKIKKWGHGLECYVVVFDAGSTGTRVHVYQFQTEHARVELVNELYQYVKPGLSDYVSNPDQSALSIQPLLDVAMTSVPQELHSSTPLIFKATAGLRLLDADGAETLLKKVREQVALTDFSFHPEDISIMSGTLEGLFGWVAVNYLLGKYRTGLPWAVGNFDRPSLTAAALDLGGGSIQITYKPKNLREASEDMEQFELFGQNYAVCSQSYLGQGLKAARNGTLKDGGDGTLIHDCLPKGYSGVHKYEGIHYSVRADDQNSQERCWHQIKQFLASSQMAPLSDFGEKSRDFDIYLFSYFYDVLKWAGIISNEMEKIITVNDYYNAANHACRIPDVKRPFLCQDLTYIVQLLGNTLNLWDKPLHVVSEINSKETSWALGAALDALSRVQAGD